MDDDLKEFCLGDDFVFGVCGINYENDSIRSWVVRRPNWTNTLLSPEVPCWQFNIFMVDLFYVTSDGGCGLYCLI